MVAKITNIIYDGNSHGLGAMLVIIIKGTEGDTKEMAEKIRKLEK